MSSNTFNLAEELGELRVKLTPYADVDTVLPEPTYLQIEAFKAVYLGRLKAMGVDTSKVSDGEQAAEAMVKGIEKKKLSDEEAAELLQELWQAVVDLCSNVFTLEDFNKMPYRGQQAFVGWLVGVFFRGEAKRPATNS